MELKQPLMPVKAGNVSEITILIVSFITAFTAGILIISALFVTVKKMEGKVTVPFDITYSTVK